MADFILVDGDTVTFIAAFPPASVTVLPGTITGTGPATIAGKPVCVEGDEASVEVAQCPYYTPIYSIPGMGTLKIKKLDAAQVATKTASGGKKVLLKGVQFEAVFEVATAAKQPPPPPGTAPPQDDTATSYSGFGSFTAANTKFRGT